MTVTGFFQARLGMLGNVDVMSTPFNVSSYTAQAIADQQAVSVADVLARDPAVRATGQGGGILDAFFIRGFAIGERNVGEIALDGQHGVAPNYRVFADYTERVEVIKGPAALLYGMSPNSGIGGVVNFLPKRALANDVTRLTLDYAGDSQPGVHLDVGRRFGAKREFGVCKSPWYLCQTRRSRHCCTPSHACLQAWSSATVRR